MESTNEDFRRHGRLALALGGGGARAAYQVGVLREIARRFPNLTVPLMTGVSAGAINIAHLANHGGTFGERVDELTDLWKRLRLEDVFTTSALSVLGRGARIVMQLTTGLPWGVPPVRGMVDTEPLRKFLRSALHTSDGRLPGIEQNLKDGRLEAVALTALSYGTGDTVTFFRGREIDCWARPRRRSINMPLTVDHIMASAALPLFFPPVHIGDDWYGDGGIRLVSPLGPAVHLGAGKVLAIAPHYPGEETNQLREQAPSPAVVLGALYNAVFLDQLDQDVLQMERLNKLLRSLPRQSHAGLRAVDLFVIRPSQDLGALAYKLKSELPRVFNHMMDRFGTRQARSEDFISTIMFHSVYIEQLIEIGERDAAALADELGQFFAMTASDPVDEPQLGDDCESSIQADYGSKVTAKKPHEAS